MFGIDSVLFEVLICFCLLHYQIYQIRTEFWDKNLDQCFVNIFKQWKLFPLIDLIPYFTSYRGPGIKSINWNSFHCSKIFTKHWSRFLSQNSVIVSVRLFGRVEYPQKTRARILIPARANWEKLKKRISVEWCSVCDNVMINFKKKQRFCAPHSPENLIKHFTQLQ